MMHRKQVALVLIYLVVLFNAEPVKRVTYNGDSRLDYYQATPQLQALGASTALLVFDAPPFTFQADTPVPGQTTLNNLVTAETYWNLCSNETFKDNQVINAVRFCTGFLISDNPGWIGTAGHCLTRSYTTIDVIFGFNQLDSVTTTNVLSSDNIYQGVGILETGNTANLDTNYGILILDRAVVGFTPYTTTNANPTPGDTLIMVSNQMGMPTKYDPDGSLTATGSVYRGLVDNYVGGAGSPIFDTNGALVALHVGGANDFQYDYNTGCAFTNNCPGGDYTCDSFGEELLPICTLGNAPSLFSLNLCPSPSVSPTTTPTITASPSESGSPSGSVSGSITPTPAATPSNTPTSRAPPSTSQTRTNSNTPFAIPPSATQTPTRSQSKSTGFSVSSSVTGTKSASSTKSRVPPTTSGTRTPSRESSPTPTTTPIRETPSGTPTETSTQTISASRASASRTSTRSLSNTRSVDNSATRTPASRSVPPSQVPESASRTPSNSGAPPSATQTPNYLEVPPGAAAIQINGFVKCDPCTDAEFAAIEQQIADYLLIPVSDVEIVGILDDTTGRVRLTVCADRDTIQQFIDGYVSGDLDIGFSPEVSFAGATYLGVCPIDDVIIPTSVYSSGNLESDASLVAFSFALLVLSVLIFV